jgi:hypothetical protein
MLAREACDYISTPMTGLPHPKFNPGPDDAILLE